MSSSYADTGKNLPQQFCFQLGSWGREGQAGLLQPWPLGQGHPSTERGDYKKVAIWESAHRIHTQDPKTNSLTSSPHLFLSK